MTCSFTIEPDDSDTIPKAVHRGISAADPEDVGPRDYAPIVVAVRNAAGAIVGGAYGATMWG